MDLENKQHGSEARPLPVVPRLDRLDRLIKLLEDKHKVSKKQGSNVEGMSMEDAGINSIKPMSTALEEVHFKGTLMDRIALLEQRVLRLSLQMDTETTPGSSSTVATSCSHGSRDESFRIHSEFDQPREVIQDVKRPPEPSLVKMQGCGYRRWRKTPVKSRKKLFEWLQI